MRKVLDINYLHEPELKNYLSSSVENCVVLPDYFGMEQYKDGKVQTTLRNLGIISKYPRQAIVLKGTRKIIQLKAQEAGMARRMIDADQTKEFPKFCKAIAALAAGDERYSRDFESHVLAAKGHFEKVRQDMTDMGETISDIGKSLGPAALQEIRTKQALSEATFKKLIEQMMWFSGEMFSKHPDVKEFPHTLKAACGTFIFRFSLCAYVWVIERLSTGAVKKLSPDKTVNHVTDMGYAAYATFFDGLLTKDSLMLQVFHDSRTLLNFIRRRAES